MGLNFNEADRQREFDLIPDGTIAPVILNLRGRKETKKQDGEMLDCEWTITAGEFDKKKIWELMMISGNGSEGHVTAIDITMSRVRAMLESAYGIDPEDDSEEAIEARTIDDWEDLDQIEVLVKIGIEKGKDGYKDKNRILAFVTPDSDDYEGFEPATPGAKKKPAAKKGAAAKKGTAAKGGSSGGAKKPSWA